MKLLRTLTVVLCACAAGWLLTPRARADSWDKKTTVVFKQPVEIPGMVLAPGKYVMRLMDSQSDRHIVQIFNADESHLYATLLTIPDDLLRAEGKTVITFEERKAGSPEALKAWFYPGDPTGEEFVYPKPRAFQLAQESKQNVLAMPSAMEKNIAKPATSAQETHVAAMKNSAVTSVTPQRQEVQIARNMAPPGPAPAPVPVAPAELPKTASDLPLFALLGALALAAGGLLRLVSGRPGN
jgi:LPXTG-motif cell wall-anchored protein